ncbi:MAG: adenylate/guanylate cyclase domain-containing protein [Alphaproteobacteria bacterium]|nr:adenylate/guanylate cyclase domain-containing protein [Alphaproteobacteria bacterium]
MKRVIIFAICGALVGIVYTWYNLGVGVFTAIRGIYVGAVIAGSVAAFETYLAEGLWARFFRAQSFLVSLSLKTVIYAGIALFALVSQHLVAPNEDISLTQFVGVLYGDIAFSLTASFIFNFIFAIHRLLGPRTLVRFITGRYHKPIQEDRVFLFLDMVGSTRLTDALGDLTFHRMLNQFYVDITDPILAHQGEIHRYVGDEVVVSWPIEIGLKDAQCLAAVRDAERALEAQADSFVASYGEAPTFRAGLHLGPVVTGEMGSAKKEFVFVGDAVNVTARIGQACRTLGRSVLISDDLLRSLELPADMRAESQGPVAMRGKVTEMTLHAISFA